MFYKALLVLFFVGATTATFAQRPPNGWRLPYAEEMTDEARNGSPSRFSKAVGDFNGDSVPDAAFLLMGTRYQGEALWVWLSRKDGSHRWMRPLPIAPQSREHFDLRSRNISAALNMGVSTMPPGIVSYVCFEHPWTTPCDDSPNAPGHALVMRNDSFEYFKPETASSLYFWSNTLQRFLVVNLTIE